MPDPDRRRPRPSAPVERSDLAINRGLPVGAKSLGIVDLGTNTSRLVVFAYQPGEWFRQVDEIRAPVRLGEGLVAGGALTKSAVTRTLAALRLYEDYARASRVDRLEVLATSAVRDATNGAAFLAEVQALGLPARVLEGGEEAALGVLAVANSFAFTDAWVVDLGGGSAQVSRMVERRSVAGQAYPLGAVRLTERFLRNDPPTPAEVNALVAEVEATLETVVAVMRRDAAPLVGMGGSLRNLARVVQKQQTSPLDVLHGFFLRTVDLERLVNRLLLLPTRRRARVRGIKADRADVILAAALVFRHLLVATGRDGIWVSGQGLRDGAFYRSFLPAPHLLPDPRRFSVDNLFRHYPQPAAHTARVRALSRALFDGFASRHGLGSAEAELLDAAATLHDIGMAVEYHEHHRHGAYLLETWSLPGFSHREQALLSLLVRFHRKGPPKPGLLRPLLRPGDGKLVRRLTACLRLAECLERSHAGRVAGLTVELAGRRARVHLASDDEDLTTELWAAARELPLLEEAFSCRVELVVERR